MAQVTPTPNLWVPKFVSTGLEARHVLELVAWKPILVAVVAAPFNFTERCREACSFAPSSAHGVSQNQTPVDWISLEAPAAPAPKVQGNVSR